MIKDEYEVVWYLQLLYLPPTMDEFVFPKRAKKNRKKTNLVTSPTFEERFERELASLFEDSAWLVTITGRISAHTRL